jgi:hypothetical protein
LKEIRTMELRSYFPIRNKIFWNDEWKIY